jgi:hypothetical protein
VDAGGVKDLDGGMTPVLFARSTSSSSSSSQNAALSSEKFLVRVGVLFRGLAWALGVTGGCGNPLPRDYRVV